VHGSTSRGMARGAAGAAVRAIVPWRAPPAGQSACPAGCWAAPAAWGRGAGGAAVMGGTQEAVVPSSAAWQAHASRLHPLLLCQGLPLPLQVHAAHPPATAQPGPPAALPPAPIPCASEPPGTLLPAARAAAPPSEPPHAWPRAAAERRRRWGASGDTAKLCCGDESDRIDGGKCIR
jgi:hypothetical protein